MTKDEIDLIFLIKSLNNDIIHFSKISGGCINDCFIDLIQIKNNISLK